MFLPLLLVLATAQAPAAPAPRAPGTLIVDTKPSMRVAVDGILVGQTPIFLEVPAGPHTITVSNAAGVRVDKPVVIVAGQQFKVVLEKADRDALGVEAPAPVAPAPPDPAVAVDPPLVVDGQPPALPTDTELRALADKDIGAARAPLRRAARTASAPGTRALALRLLATSDASTATARICARSLRLDEDPLVRRSGAECLGRLGVRLAAAHTAALTGSLQDPSLDVVTMSGWAIANVGDAGAVREVAALVTHPDPRVGRLFRGYAERMRDRLGLTSEQKPAVDDVAPSADSPTAVPPGVALTFPARGIDVAASTGWLGVYGAMAGWFHGPLLLAAHGGEAGANAGSLAALGLAAVGAASMSGYGFARADSLPLAHTVVQFGTLGAIAGYGGGQLVGFAPTSAVASANLSLAGSLIGTGVGIAFVELEAPTLGALSAGMASSIIVGASAATLAASYGYPFDQSLGVLLVTGGVAGGATTALLAKQDIGLFPVAGAGLGALLVGGGSAVLMAGLEGAGPTEATGWVILSGFAVGTALGGMGGWALPHDIDPLLAGTLRLNPPTLGLLPPAGTRTEATPLAMISGSF
ncbi:MAG: PEGA domain-containing protein [Deltaproteobacteria bacterium]|nr:PEGA domain-containing protein [Deltaproteobacteria bacterium]